MTSVKLLFLIVFCIFIYKESWWKELHEKLEIFYSIITYSTVIFHVSGSICDALRDLVPCAQFKNVKINHGRVLLLVKLDPMGIPDPMGKPDPKEKVYLRS